MEFSVILLCVANFMQACSCLTLWRRFRCLEDTVEKLSMDLVDYEVRTIEFARAKGFIPVPEVVDGEKA